MAVWLENFNRIFGQKEVLIIHGNIRDEFYIKKNGQKINGLTDLIKFIAKKHHYHQIQFLGKSVPPWSNPEIINIDESVSNEFNNDSTDNYDNKDEKKQMQKRPIPPDRTLLKWAQEDIKDVAQNTVFVIFYIDKLTPYSGRSIYPQEIMNYIIAIQKLIGNISANNRLLMIALQDSMVPVEYYINSSKTAIINIPMPDKDERSLYLSNTYNRKFNKEYLEVLSNLSEGLYIRDLDNIVRNIIQKNESKDLTIGLIKKSVNQYRFGTEEDPWEKLPIVSYERANERKGLLDNARDWFLNRIKGQDHAVDKLINGIIKARAGLTGIASGQTSKPRGVFFFAGPTGVGKTFLAKQLTVFLFDTDKSFIRFDMSEFKEEHTVSKLIGAPPGYVGYEQGGMLTNAVRNRPFSIILFDEMEKAHPKIMDIFLQILDDGRLTDSRGQTVFFTESVIIFTSNIGTRNSSNQGNPIDEKERLTQIIKDNNPEQKEIIEKVKFHFVKSVENFFMHEISRPELLNRFGSSIIAFNYINDESVQKEIFQSKLRDIQVAFRDKFSKEGHRLEFSDEVVRYLLKKYKSKIADFGGRGLVNAIDDEIISLLAEEILYVEHDKRFNVTFSVVVENDSNNVYLKCETN